MSLVTLLVDIPYDSITDIRIEKRTISTAEVFLGGGNDANQAAKCREFMDLLRQKDILELIESKKNTGNNTGGDFGRLLLR